MKYMKLTLVFLIFMILSVFAESKQKIVCYYGSWASYRQGNGQMKINDINPKLCTHIIYSFIGITDDGHVKILDAYNEIINNGFKKFFNLKKRNPNVKLLIAMGGWNEGSEKYSQIMSSVESRHTLINSIIEFIEKWGFDGFDLDWEYPSQRGGLPADKNNLIKFLKELRESTGNEFIMSAAVGAGDYLVSSAYDVKNLNKYLDFINLMTYDFHGSWDQITGHNAPFYSLENTIKNWIRNGASYEKLILGIPIYGRTWTLSNSYSHNIGALATGAGAAGKYTKENGIMTYLEICESFYSSNWIKLWDPIQKVPYAFNNNQWLSYDNIESVEIKVEYAIKLNLGGVMIWSIDGDDVHGVCGKGLYPILNAINRLIEI